MWRNCGENENLALPQKNDFIPTDFELFPRESDSVSNIRYYICWIKGKEVKKKLDTVNTVIIGQSRTPASDINILYNTIKRCVQLKLKYKNTSLALLKYIHNCMVNISKG